MSSTKCRPFCLGLNVLINRPQMDICRAVHSKIDVNSLHFVGFCGLIPVDFTLIHQGCFTGTGAIICLPVISKAPLKNRSHELINTLKPGPWFNIKMTSYRYRKSHCGDKTVVRSSYLHNGISYTGKMTSLYWIRALITHICVSEMGQAMAFVPIWHQAVTWTSDNCLLIGPTGRKCESKYTNFLSTKLSWNRILQTGVHFVQNVLDGQLMYPH